MLRRSLLAAALAVLLPVSASAVPITMTFTAAGFTPVGAPDDPVSGVITWEAAGVNATIDMLTSVNLTIAGHSYVLAELDVMSPLFGNDDIVGGALNTVTTVNSGTDDFWIRWNRVTGVPFDLLYSAAGEGTVYQAFTFTVFEITAAIPEPAALAVLAFGLAGLGLLRRGASPG